jgi:uncharacterized protein
MTLKRLLLISITVIVVFLVGSSLARSWSEPQISSRLQLYQTDLVLHAEKVPLWLAILYSDQTRSAMHSRNTKMSVSLPKQI